MSQTVQSCPDPASACAQRATEGARLRGVLCDRPIFARHLRACVGVRLTQAQHRHRRQGGVTGVTWRVEYRPASAVEPEQCLNSVCWRPVPSPAQRHRKRCRSARHAKRAVGARAPDTGATPTPSPSRSHGSDLASGIQTSLRGRTRACHRCQLPLSLREWMFANHTTLYSTCRKLHGNIR